MELELRNQNSNLMKKIVTGIKNFTMINNTKNTAKDISKKNTPKIKKDNIANKNMMVCDMGAAFFKLVGYKLKRIDFYNSSKKIYRKNINGDTTVIKINDQYWKIGDLQSDPETSKAKKDYVPCVLYGVSRMLQEIGLSGIKVDEKGIINIDLVLLLPENQMDTQDDFRKVLEGKIFKCTVHEFYKKNDYKIRIHIEDIKLEGMSSIMCLNEEYIEATEKCVVANLGCSTSDFFYMDCKTMQLLGLKSINQGSRYLFEDLVDILTNQKHALPNGKAVENLFINKNPILTNNNEVEEYILEYFGEIMKSMNRFMYTVSHDATILFCGGTSLIMKGAIKRYFKSIEGCEYNIVFIDEIYKERDEDKNDIGLARFSDALGAYMWTARTLRERQKDEKRLGKNSKKKRR